MSDGERKIQVTEEELAELHGLASLSLHALAGTALFAGLFIASFAWALATGSLDLAPVTVAACTTMTLALMIYKRLKVKIRELNEFLIRRSQRQGDGAGE